MKPEEIMIAEYKELKEEIRVSQVKGQNSISFVFVVALIAYMKILSDILASTDGNFIVLITLIIFPVVYGAIIAFYLKNFHELMMLGSYLLKLEIKINCYFKNKKSEEYRQNVMGWENYLGKERRKKRYKRFTKKEYGFYAVFFVVVYFVGPIIAYPYIKASFSYYCIHLFIFAFITAVNIIVSKSYWDELKIVFDRMDKDFKNRKKCKMIS